MNKLEIFKYSNIMATDYSGLTGSSRSSRSTGRRATSRIQEYERELQDVRRRLREGPISIPERNRLLMRERLLNQRLRLNSVLVRRSEGRSLSRRERDSLDLEEREMRRNIRSTEMESQRSQHIPRSGRGEGRGGERFRADFPRELARSERRREEEEEEEEEFLEQAETERRQFEMESGQLDEIDYRSLRRFEESPDIDEVDDNGE